jgi:hypothetical protein
MFRKFHGLNISLEHQKSNKVQKILWGAAVLQKKIETFAKLHKPSNFVIPDPHKARGKLQPEFSLF